MPQRRPIQSRQPAQAAPATAAAVGTRGRAAGGGQGNAARAEALAAANQRAPDVALPALTEDSSVTAEGLRRQLANSRVALEALNRLTGSASFTALTPAQQGGILAQFRSAPNGATAERLIGMATAHGTSGTDQERADAWQQAARPDGGTLQSGGTTYNIRNGQLLGADGQVTGEIGTDGNWRLNADAAGTSRNVYNDINTRVRMTEGTGRNQRELLDLFAADPRGRLTNQNMNPQFADRATSTIRNMRREGQSLGVTDGFRSVQEQDRLYARGRTAGGPRVTNAPGGSSWHNYGVAADMAFHNDQGDLNWEEGGNNRTRWTRYGELAEAQGLEWGGRWTGLVDNPHVEHNSNGRRAGAMRTILNRQGLQGVWNELGIGGR